RFVNTHPPGRGPCPRNVWNGRNVWNVFAMGNDGNETPFVPTVPIVPIVLFVPAVRIVPIVPNVPFVSYRKNVPIVPFVSGVPGPLRHSPLARPVPPLPHAGEANVTCRLQPPTFTGLRS